MFDQDHLINNFTGSKSLPLIMGILNITDDSFYDGNKHFETNSAITHANKLISDGADIIDIGGESTRPGSIPIDAREEIARVIPVVKALRDYSGIPISIDTRKAEVAKLAIEEGVDIINDISALRFDDQLTNVLSNNPQVMVILMHMQGEPENMQINPQYKDVLQEIKIFFTERIEFCLKHNINRNRIILDPGIGFGKTTEHNLEILANLDYFDALNLPLVIGASRKRFINDIAAANPDQRLGGSLAATAACLNNKVDIIRVHDVYEHKQFININAAIRNRWKI